MSEALKYAPTLRCISDKSFIGVIIMLMLCVIGLLNAREIIKCKTLENSNKKVCNHPSRPFKDTCCYNFEMDYYYCCPVIEFRRWEYGKRFSGLIAAVILIIVFILFLCLFCTKCPLGKLIHRRRQGDQQAEAAQV